MLSQIIQLVLITLLPFLELRASIPYGILKFNMHFTVVFLICVIVKIILGIIIYLFLEKIIKILTIYVEKTQGFDFQKKKL